MLNLRISDFFCRFRLGARFAAGECHAGARCICLLTLPVAKVKIIKGYWQWHEPCLYYWILGEPYRIVKRGSEICNMLQMASAQMASNV